MAKIEVELPEIFEIKTYSMSRGSETRVSVYLWGSPIFGQTYPFPITEEHKVKAAVQDLKSDFVRSLRAALDRQPVGMVG